MEQMSKSQKAELIMPVARVKAMLKVGKFGNRVSDKAAVFMTATLEYLITEILELSINCARSDGVKRIQPRHVNIALKTDPEYSAIFNHAGIKGSTMIPKQINSRSYTSSNGQMDLAANPDLEPGPSRESN
ncbi:histone H2A-beta, sperm-like [Uloborus diversus]|uniref:histone H2A-beta, sperm-like n=1 Tax=Uloborus diversus TaxID=327109 RepID=UPI00240924E1|nr:histone H2A-beta, sperm-like [Uloborus diversus]